jgi:P-type E1-E2 ATPase
MVTDKTLFSNDFLLAILKIGITAVVLMIVAIPEGLPLAVSIAMALSISRLKKDEILIKNLESIQSAAMLHDLCVGKTGTITKANMNVSKYQIGDAYTLVHEHNRDESLESL